MSSSKEFGGDRLPAGFDCLNKSLHAFVRVGVTHQPSPAVGPLHGWTIAIKDCFDLAGEVASVGTPMFAARRATRTATVVQRLLDAGAHIVGHANMVELAFGGWGINSAMGTPRNPWDGRIVRVAGGSSSGSAVAVAARMVRAALGSDTAGSIRMPAALCGITGLKTTFGLIAEDGVFPLAESYDSVGPMAHSADDCARLLEVLMGTTLAPLQAPGGWRICVFDSAAYPVPVEPVVQRALDEAANVFVRLGARPRKGAPPFALADLTHDAGTLIGAEAWELHRARFQATPCAFGAELQRRFEQARTTGPQTIATARAARIEASGLFRKWFSADEVLLMPTVHCSAPPLDTVDERGSPLGQFTRWVNHVGGCALALPAGFDALGLPVSIQLVGQAGSEARLLALGSAFQQVTDWHRKVPDLALAAEA
jgi:aspartyl-tRNA(Asn)/glutamyl-tRNA(Gln) amidotransferase subunit A